MVAGIQEKLRLQEILEHQLGVLRELLNNFRVEQLSVESNVRGDYVSLLRTNKEWQSQLTTYVAEMCPSTENIETKSLPDLIALLREVLSADDFELLLLCNQFESILNELPEHGENLTEENLLQKAHDAHALIPVCIPKQVSALTVIDPDEEK